MLTCPFCSQASSGSPVGGGTAYGRGWTMPGPWIHLPRNLEFFKELAVAEGGYVELEQFDSDGERQGTALWQVDHIIEKKKEGLWLQARLVAATDEHLGGSREGQGRTIVAISWSTCAQRPRASAVRRNVTVNKNSIRTRSGIFHRAISRHAKSAGSPEKMSRKRLMERLPFWQEQPLHTIQLVEERPRPGSLDTWIGKQTYRNRD